MSSSFLKFLAHTIVTRVPPAIQYPSAVICTVIIRKLSFYLIWKWNYQICYQTNHSFMGLYIWQWKAIVYFFKHNCKVVSFLFKKKVCMPSYRKLSIKFRYKLQLKLERYCAAINERKDLTHSRWMMIQMCWEQLISRSSSHLQINKCEKFLRDIDTIRQE